MVCGEEMTAHMGAFEQSTVVPVDYLLYVVAILGEVEEHIFFLIWSAVAWELF